MRSIAIRAGAMLCCLLSASAALAHSGGAGSHPFLQVASELPAVIGGMLHPLVVPAHLMAVLGLALLIGQQLWGRLVMAGYCMALVAGLAILTLGAAPHGAGEALLFVAAINGALIALARPLPELLGGALAGLTGFILALDSPPEAVSLREGVSILIGTGIGGSALLVLAAACALRLTHSRLRQGMRLAGAAIAVGAIMSIAPHISH